MSPIDPLYDDDLDRASWTKHAGDRPIRIEVPGIDLCEETPFLTIWTRPRETIRAIVETDPTWHVAPIAILAAIAQGMQRASTRSAGDQLSFTTILTLMIVAGPLAGLASLHVMGWLLALTGRWLGGRAGAEQVRAAIAWSSVPSLTSLPIGILLLGVLGREVFTTKTPTIDAYPTLGLLLLSWQFLTALLRSWSALLLIKCLSELQGFSAWKAFGSMLLAGLVFVGPIVLLMIVFMIGAR